MSEKEKTAVCIEECYLKGKPLKFLEEFEVDKESKFLVLIGRAVMSDNADAIKKAKSARNRREDRLKAVEKDAEKSDIQAEKKTESKK